MFFYRNIVFAFFFGLILTLYACSNKPDGILEPDKMKKVLLHNMMVDEYINYYLIADSLEQKKDSIRAQMYLDVLSLHKTDTTAFSKSLVYYKSNISEFAALMDSLNAYVVRERDKRFAAIEKATNDSLQKIAKADSLKLAASADSLKKLKGTDTLKSPADSLK